MNDLLSSVKAGPRKPKGRDDEPDEEVDEEDGVAPPPTDRQLEMKEFFAAVAPIKTSMAAISSLQEEMLRMHENSKTGLVKSKDIRKHQDLMGVGVQRAAGSARSRVCAHASWQIHCQPCMREACNHPKEECF
jgi:hypothetical protein